MNANMKKLLIVFACVVLAVAVIVTVCLLIDNRDAAPDSDGD